MDSQLSEALATKYLIQEFENDLRNVVKNSILPEIDFTEIVSRYELEAATSDALLENLYIGQAIETLNIHKNFLSSETLSDLASVMNSNLFQETIYRARNNNAHSRTSNAFEQRDFHKTQSLLESLASPEWILTAEACSRLRNGTLSNHLQEVIGPELGCLNNLPSREYLDTSLVGRNDEVKEIRNLLARYRYVSIIAPGGIGKSALALEVARQMTNTREFDLVLWHSAKLNIWSVDGALELDGVETDLERSMAALGTVLDSDFVGNFNDFIGVIDGVRTLIVLDNFETFTGTEFLSLVERFPIDADIRLLITSRHGTGTIERRFDLQPLSESAALQLLKKLSAIYNVREVSNLSYENKIKLINDYGKSPLAIRWLVQCLAAGKSIIDINNSRGDLLNYCVTSVLDNLSSEARTVIAMLYVYKRPIPLAELNLLLNLDYVGDLRPILQELGQRSILQRSSSDLSLSEDRISLSDVVSDYLQKTSEFFNSEEIQEARRHKSEVEDRLRSQDATAHPLNPWNLYIRSEADKPASENLRRAMSISKTRYDDALRITSDLKSANPGYFEIDRVEAFIYSARDTEKSLQHYQSAYSAANPGMEQGKVAYHFSDFLGRQENSLKEAIKFAKIAHTSYSCADSMSQLGYLLVRDNQMQEGVDLISLAISESSPTSKTHLVALTQLAKSFERWAEQYFSSLSEVNEFWTLCEKGFYASKKAFTLNQGDKKAAETLVQIVLLSLRKIQRSSSSTSTSESLIHDFVIDATQIHKAMTLLGDSYKANSRLRVLVEDISESRDDCRELSKILNATNLDLTGSVLPDGSLVGRVTGLKPKNGFGFIKFSNDQEYYLHVTNLVSEDQWELLEIGTLVSFRKNTEPPALEENKLPSAHSVRVIPN